MGVFLNSKHYFLNQLMLPLLGFLLANTDQLIKLIR